MSMITNITNTPNINRAFLPSKFESRPLVGVQKADEISFTGTGSFVVRKTRDVKEIKELVKLFMESIEHSVKGKVPKPFKNKFLNKLQNSWNKFLAMPFVFTAKQPEAVTEVVRGVDNKLLGGYSMFFNSRKLEAYVGFIAVSPELKNTKKSREMLLAMGKRIYENAKANDIIWVTGTTNNKNKPIQRLLRRFEPDEYDFFRNEKEFSIPIERFKKVLDKSEMSFGQ